MARTDGTGLPLSTTSTDAAEAYEEGVEQLLAGEGGAAPLFTRALAHDDGFALGHMALAIALDEEKDAAGAARHRATAKALAAAATPREQAHVELLATLSAGPDARAMEGARAHLVAFPRDGLVLDALGRHLFFHGGQNRRTTLVELFEAIASAWDGHWYWSAKLALHLEETGDLTRATALAERSYQGRPRNASAIHALIHIAHASGRHVDGTARLAEWLTGLDGRAPLHGHLWWHVALTALVAEDWATARALYEAKVRPSQSSGTRPLSLADAVGLLWSWAAVSPKTAPPWDEAAALARDFAKSPGRPFTDIHVAVALLAQGDRAALAALEAAIATSPHPLARSTSLPLVRSIALVLDDPATASQQLLAADTDAMGGSNVERALLVEVAVHAAHLAGRTLPAAAIASPHPLVARMAARTHGAA